MSKFVSHMNNYRNCNRNSPLQYFYIKSTTQQNLVSCLKVANKTLIIHTSKDNLVLGDLIFES